ncbi:hypothetical protein PG993_012698 [Apiospora rasikravindrae]|uniref:Uncharacterized protein n=1 Tax=Apiospora rasikravindrae TaxID=990691 RepID=A0ABR1S372_9PEZI
MDAQNEKIRTGETNIFTIHVGDGELVDESGGYQHDVEQPTRPLRSFRAKCIQKWYQIVSHLPARVGHALVRPAVLEFKISEKPPTSSSPTMSAPPPSPSGSGISIAPASTPPGEYPKHTNLPPHLPANTPFAIKGRIINPVHTPTVEHCKQVIEMERDTTLFHSGGMGKGGFLSQVLQEKRPYLHGYAPLCQKHTSHDFSEIYKYNPQAWSNLSQALAEISSGTAYVLLPPGRGEEGVPRSGHFIKDELPHLGPQVDRLIRIRHDDPNSFELLYERQPFLPPPLPPPSPPRPATPRPATPPETTSSSSRYNLRGNVRIKLVNYKGKGNGKRQRVAPETEEEIIY